MREVTDEEFDLLIQRALAELPDEYIKNLIMWLLRTLTIQPRSNWCVIMYDTTNYCLAYTKVCHKRPGFSSGYSGVLPDKITIFKNPIRYVTHDDESFFEQIKRTVWHEIAHHYGLGARSHSCH